jgi:FkbH-like protein
MSGDVRFIDLSWLAPPEGVAEHLRRVAAEKQPAWAELVGLANLRLDFVQTNRLDKALQRAVNTESAERAAWGQIKLAVLSSSTVDHLLPSLRVAALRRNLRLETFVGDYGLYRQELQDEDAPLHKAKPDVMLFAFHAQHLLGTPDPGMSAAAADAVVDAACEAISSVWRLARRRFSGQIIQQTILPTFLPLVGSNEARLPGSGARLVERINARLEELAPAENVDVLSLQRAISIDGVIAWHDPGLWHRAKQEISPAAAPAFGELAMRLIGAQKGRSAKCLVLDLDNTLWGGVIGDDGLEGIKLGQGSALGEAYVAFQTYARDLSRRGVILAVCSKNDAENARAPFERHPDMVLKMQDIACFVANWNDKASNLRLIAEQLNIGIDSLVFVDDNPFERNIVRRELPMVAVPEMPEDPAFYPMCLANAGYFEALQITTEDLERGGQYRANMARESLRASHTDLEGYLKSLNMELRWQPFDRVGLQRVVQLINKTNQFNLTTQRYTEADVLAIMNSGDAAVTLQLRLIDQFGDNGIIGIVIGKLTGANVQVDTWLMSCRVLGRQVEEATMNLLAAESRRVGAGAVIGEYRPTKKNSMVREHYRKLGFEQLPGEDQGTTRWTLSLTEFQPFPTFIKTVRSEQ